MKNREEELLLDDIDTSKKNSNPYLFLYLEIGLLCLGLLLGLAIWSGVARLVGFSLLSKAISVYLFTLTVIYSVQTFRKPQFTIAAIPQKILGTWNLINFSIFFLTYQFRWWQWANLAIYSSLFYFVLLSIWEAHQNPTKRFSPVFLFHIGVVILLVSLRNFGSDTLLLIFILEGISFLLMLHHILQDKLQYAAFVFYFPRQVAILFLCLFLYLTN